MDTYTVSEKGTVVDAQNNRIPIKSPHSVWETNRVKGIIKDNYFEITELVDYKPIHKVAGTLVLFNKKRYGINKNRVPYYLFVPLDKSLPYCKVASSYKPNEEENGINIYVVVNITSPSVGNNLANGEMVAVVGAVTSIEAMNNVILYRYFIPPKKTLSSPSDISKTVEFKWLHHDINIYTIDPSGCMDIDDSISFQLVSDEICKIGIHITDITHLLRMKPDLIELYKKQPFTIYSPDKTYHILPEHISCGVGSLFEHQERKVISLYLIIDIEKCEIISTEFQNEYITVTKNLTYEKANELIETDPRWSSISQLLSVLIKNDTIPIQSVEPSHQIVDYLMVYMNRWVANKLIELSPSEGVPLRTHTKNIELLSSFSHSDVSFNVSLQNYLNSTRDYKAQYMRFTDSSEQRRDVSHKGLNCDYYLHFTSPLRRYADVLSHVLVHKYIFHSRLDDEILFAVNNTNMEYVNSIEKKNKKMYRLWELNKILYELWDNTLQTETILIDWTIGKSVKFELYCPTLKKCFQTKIVHKEIINCFRISEETNSICINEVRIERGISITIKLWWEYVKGVEGTRIEIVSPSFLCFSSHYK